MDADVRILAFSCINMKMYDVVHTIIEIGVRDVFRTDIAGQQWRSCDFWSKRGLRSLSPDEVLVRRNRLVSNMIEEAVPGTVPQSPTLCPLSWNPNNPLELECI